MSQYSEPTPIRQISTSVTETITNNQAVSGNSETDRLYDFLKTSGFRIFEYQVEEEYEKSYNSWRGKAPSARYHFVEMVTEGGHGINRPLQNFEIAQFHPDLSLDEIQSLRELYERNAGIRPFKLPMQVARVGISDADKAKINQNLDLFYAVVQKNAPLIERRVPTFVGASYDIRPSSLEGTSVKTVSLSAPPRPEVGDIWFNSTKGKYFAFLGDGVSKYWVEV